MLDTSAVSAFLKRRSPRLDAWVREQRCCLSSLVVAEIRYGLEKLPAATRLRTLAEATIETLEIPVMPGVIIMNSHTTPRDAASGDLWMRQPIAHDQVARFPHDAIAELWNTRTACF